MIYTVWVIVGVSTFLLLACRLWDEHADRAEWTRLASSQTATPLPYDPAMVSNLPEPAQRFFNFAIVPGTPLLTVAEIDMEGEFSLGTRDNPHYRPMYAKQILASPTGFVWKARMPGTVSVSGSDTGSWTRFRIFGLVPVARMGGNSDHARAAFGRYVAEAVFWTPAALLPGSGVAWEAVDQDSARVTVIRGELSQTVTVRVAADGQPILVDFMRWSNANPEKIHRLQPFGGELSHFREVQGFRIPFHVHAGNMFGTDEEFVFFKARLTGIRFLPPSKGT